MPSPLLPSFLAALQSSLSVLLTLSYGILAAALRLLSPHTAQEVSHICVEMFLPALLVTSIGKDLAREGQDGGGGELGVVIVWALAYPLISLLLAYPFVRCCRFPTWHLAASAFNNTTALPLLLLQSLRTTGILDSISQGDPEGAADKAKTLFLLNAMVNNVLTFALGPKLLGTGGGGKEGEEEEREDVVGGAVPHSIITIQGVRDAQEDVEVGVQHAEEDAEDTPLLSKRLQRAATHEQLRVKHLTHSVLSHLQAGYLSLPSPIRRVLRVVRSVINPPLVGALLAILIATVPALKRAMFNTPGEGGWFRAWGTTSLENIGDLFNALQMFVVGSKLYESVVHPPKRQREEQDVPAPPHSNDPERPASLPPPQDTHLRLLPTLYLLFLRFLLLPALALALTYLLATHTTLLPSQTKGAGMLYFVLMLSAGGPPAINLASLAEVAGEGAEVQGAIARFLVVCYAVTPAVCFSVVAALRVSEAILDQKGL